MPDEYLAPIESNQFEFDVAVDKRLGRPKVVVKRIVPILPPVSDLEKVYSLEPSIVRSVITTKSRACQAKVNNAIASGQMNAAAKKYAALQFMKIIREELKQTGKVDLTNENWQIKERVAKELGYFVAKRIYENGHNVNARTVENFKEGLKNAR